LATTQMQLIAEIERLRQRQRQTSWMVVVLAIALVALIAWLIGQR
jgi:predicted nucleic acid-binding Zn ribbon protein